MVTWQEYLLPRPGTRTLGWQGARRRGNAYRLPKCRSFINADSIEQANKKRAEVWEVNLEELLLAAYVSCIYDSIKLMQISRYTLFVCRGISYKIAKRSPLHNARNSELEACFATSQTSNFQRTNQSWKYAKCEPLRVIITAALLIGFTCRLIKIHHQL